MHVPVELACLVWVHWRMRWGLALALARRDRLVTTLAVSAGVLVLAWLALNYRPAPWDLNRLAGHGSNLALVALLLALAARMGELHPQWRGAAGALLVGLMVWPTVAAPVRSLGLSLERGVQLANANAVQRIMPENREPEPQPRFQIPPMSAALATYIRDRTAVRRASIHSQVAVRDCFDCHGPPKQRGVSGTNSPDLLPGSSVLGRPELP